MSCIVVYEYNYFQVLQYKQRCADLETQMAQIPPDQPSSLTYMYPTTTHTASLDELRDENIKDLDNALRKLQEERKRYVNIIDFKLNEYLFLIFNHCFLIKCISIRVKDLNCVSV